MQTTTPLQEAIILSSIIGSLMSNYDPKLASERLKPIEVIRARIKKFMYQRARTNAKEFREALIYADRAWQKSIDHFAEHNYKIESVSTIIRLYDLYSKPLSRFVNLHEKQMEAFSMHQSKDVTVEIEQQSYEVSDFMLSELAVFTGVERVDKLLFLKGNK